MLLFWFHVCGNLEKPVSYWSEGWPKTTSRFCVFINVFMTDDVNISVTDDVNLYAIDGLCKRICDR